MPESERTSREISLENLLEIVAAEVRGGALELEELYDALGQAGVLTVGTFPNVYLGSLCIYTPPIVTRGPDGREITFGIVKPEPRRFMIEEKAHADRARIAVFEIPFHHVPGTPLERIWIAAWEDAAGATVRELQARAQRILQVLGQLTSAR